MFKAITALMLSLAVYSSSFADNTVCQEPSKTVALWPALGYQVASTGRLYFHAAPNEKCVDKNIFVIPGDSLIAHEEYREWSKVTYILKTGKYYDGWVITKRLKFTGTDGRTEPEEFEFYEKAAKAAKAGKLGSPWQD